MKAPRTMSRDCCAGPSGWGCLRMTLMNCGSELPRRRLNPKRGIRTVNPAVMTTKASRTIIQKNPYRESFGLLRARIRDLEQGGNSVSEYVRKTSTSNAREEEINNKDDFGVGGGGGGGEAQAAIQRGLQELRNKGASVEELEAAGSALHSVVGDGSSDQQQQNIAKIKELTRGQVFTDTGGGYVQTDPNAIVTIRIDDQGNIVGSTTSREIPDTPWDTFLKEQEALLVEANAARRAGDPNNPIDQRAAAFRELREVAGAEGFSSAEFEAFAATGRLPDRLRPDTVLAGGGAMPADTATFLGVGGDLTPGVISPGEARAMGRPDLAGYTKEVGADGQVVAVPPEGGYDPQVAAAAEAAQSWAAAQSDRMGYLESKGYDGDAIENMSQAEIDNLIDVNVASDQQAVAAAQSDRMGYLESKGYDGDAIENMSQAEIDNLMDVNVASDQQAVAAAQSDRMGYLESKGYDGDAIENMSQAEIDNLIDVNVASDQQAVAAAQSDRMGYLESKGYDGDAIENMSQAEIDNLIDVNVASDQQAGAAAQSDVMGSLESQGYDADTSENMSQTRR